MDRVVTSTPFLVSTAVCCGVTVWFALWVTEDSSAVARAFAALVALVACMSVMLLIAWALADAEGAPSAVVEASPAAPQATVAQPESLVAPMAMREDLDRRLAEAMALRDELDPGVADPRVDSWIEGVRQTLLRNKAGVAGYFNALATRHYDDDRSRLDAHATRLATIARDML